MHMMNEWLKIMNTGSVEILRKTVIIWHKIAELMR